MRRMIRTVLPSLLVLLAAGTGQPLGAQSRQSQVAAEKAGLKEAGVRACSLLTNDEIRKVTGRTAAWELNEEPYDQNSLCDFSGIVTVRVYASSGGREAIDAVLKNYQIEDPRVPVSGFGSNAFLMYPAPRSQDADRYALLVADAGATLFMMTLVAPEGETGESVRPQLLELAKIVLTRLL